MTDYLFTGTFFPKMKLGGSDAFCQTLCRTVESDANCQTSVRQSV